MTRLMKAQAAEMVFTDPPYNAELRQHLPSDKMRGKDRANPQRQPGRWLL